MYQKAKNEWREQIEQDVIVSFSIIYKLDQFLGRSRTQSKIPQTIQFNLINHKPIFRSEQSEEKKLRLKCRNNLKNKGEC